MKYTKRRIHNKPHIIKKNYIKHTKKHNNIKYDKTYFIDSCVFIDKSYYPNEIIKYLKTYGLKEDRMMNIIRKSDMLYLKKHNIKPKPNECLQLLGVYKNKLFNLNKLKPMVLLFNTQITDKRLYNVQCLLSNVLNLEVLNKLTKKEQYLDLQKYYPDIYKKYMAKTFYINEINNYKFPKMYILRPVISSGGQDILYVSNKKELDKAIKYYNTTNFYYERDKIYHGNNVIASEYIMNPLLYKNKKFHLRSYYLLTYINNEFNTFYIENNKIITSLNDYNTDKPFLPEVHDTHFKYSKTDILFPEDIKTGDFNKDVDISNIMEQMRRILKYTTKILTKTLTINKETLLYNNQENGYLLTGVDFMIDDNGNVFLIEINRTPGLALNTEIAGRKMLDVIYKLYNEVILQPLFNKEDVIQTQKDIQNAILKHPYYLDISNIE